MSRRYRMSFSTTPDQTPGNVLLFPQQPPPPPPTWVHPQAKPPAGEWWRRDAQGRLEVWCRRWHLAPVPECAGEPPKREHPNPARITLALDLRILYGPEVDEALGVLTEHADVVDRWEAGTLRPTLAEMKRLATLTRMPIGFFYDLAEVARPRNVFTCKMHQ